jgi:transmembrane sensor
MSPTPEHFDAATEAASAAWLARRDRGFSPAEQDEFLQWLREDPRHRDCFARQEQAWQRLDTLSRWRPQHSAEPNPDLLARPRPSPHRWRLPLSLAAAAAVFAAGWLALRWHHQAMAPVLLAAPATAPGEREHGTLADGSLITLTHGSRAEVRYTAAERRVQLLQGEAHFNVTKDPARPFIVRVGQVDVRAVGTAFNVRLDARAVEVLVTEGRVQVTPSAGTATLPILTAGQRAVVPTGSGSARIETVPAEEMSRFTPTPSRQLEFDSARLADVVAAFNRHNHVQLEIADPDLADLAIGASFRSNNVTAFVRLLESGFGITAERTGDRIVLRRSNR